MKLNCSENLIWTIMRLVADELPVYFNKRTTDKKKPQITKINNRKNSND